MKIPALAAALLGSVFLSAPVRAASPATTPIEGLRDATPRVHALVGARIVVSPAETIENGTVVVRDGVIEAVGAGLAAPPDARVWNVRGRTIYAGFIESESSLFLPASWKSAGGSSRPRGNRPGRRAGPRPMRAKRLRHRLLRAPPPRLRLRIQRWARGHGIRA
jgi:hypothetical protein